MLKRTLVFTTPWHLSLRNAQMVVSLKELPDEQRTIPIEDIGVVIIENQMVTITMPLMNALVDASVAVILCDAKGMPHAMVQNFDSHNLQGEYLRNQISLGDVGRKQLWKQIIEAKIKNQAALLEKVCGEGDVLKVYYSNVKSGDKDNREGAAAKVYFSKLFGRQFVRDRNLGGINAMLNYGYSILRAATARALVSSGLTPSLGIFHHNRSNAFPLADDLMEAFRPFVDEIVLELCRNNEIELTKDNKSALINVLNVDTYYAKVTRPLQVGLSITTASLAKYYSGENKVLALPLLK
jgi:CRISPR-associated protein Cas1